MARLRTLLELGRSRRTETALLAGFVVLAAILGMGAWQSVAKLNDFIAVSDRSRYHAHVVAGLEAALADVQRAESDQRGYLVTGDTGFLVTYDASIVAARGHIDDLLMLTASDASLRARIAEVQQLSEKRFEYFSEAIHLHRTGRESQADEYVKAGRPLSINTRTRFAQVQSEYENALAQAHDQAQALRTDTLRWFAITAALATAVLGLMALMVIFEARFIRALSERLLHASRHDELTELPNRAYLNEWLERGIAAAKRSNEKLALLYLDLNGFKQVNDTLGHQAGDDVLVEIARKLESAARDADFAARLGGDEFAVVMPRVGDRAQAETAARRFAALKVEKGPHVVGASVGFAVYPDDADSGKTLMQVSDAAMYARKMERRRT